MGTKSTHRPVCFLFERQIWFVNYCRGSRVLLVLRRYIVSWREYLGCLEFFFFFGKHGDEKFNISFVLFSANFLLQFSMWNSFPWLLHSKALNPLWICKYKNMVFVVFGYNFWCGPLSNQIWVWCMHIESWIFSDLKIFPLFFSFFPFL